MSNYEAPITSESDPPPSIHDHIDEAPKALARFTPFPKLPIEIRFKIWRWSFPQGRQVNFDNELIFKDRSESNRGGTIQFEDPTPLPATLHINRESQ
jgi:hypothetical protein